MLNGQQDKSWLAAKSSKWILAQGTFASWHLITDFLDYLLPDSFTWANGICENNCKSTIRHSRRSN